MLSSLTPRELFDCLVRGDDLVLLDVREPGEVAICAIAGSLNVPLGELARRVDELDPARPTVCICHHGLRSGNAAAFLLARGFDDVYNLSGGVERWALEVDPGMARY